jgi:hypothetical protein
MSGPVSRDLGDQIRGAITTGLPRSVLYLGVGKLPLAIKYIPAKWSAAYNKPGQKLMISESPGFTWGRATYVTSLAFPLSTAIFGRAGIVCEYDPKGWHIFDATIPDNRQLYLRWMQAQQLYEQFALSAQSAYLSQFLRNSFRQNYEIDCVLFHPDQSHPRYTKPKSDIWMAVTDWTNGPGSRIARGKSKLFKEPRLTVVIEEEFEDRRGGIHRAGRFNLASALPGGNLSDRFAQAYHRCGLERIPS